MATGLTPTGAALDRSTPGFDALIGALQNTASRIEANREFARQVQAREDFARFQADLNLEMERRKIDELMPVETEALVNREKVIGKVQNDLAVSRQEAFTKLRIETMPEINEALLQIEMNRMDALLPYEERRERALQRIRGNEQIRAHRATIETNIQDIEDRTREFINDEYGEVLNDPNVQVVRPTYDPETDSFLPVHITVGDDIQELQWNEYLNYLELHKNRLYYEQKFQDRLERSDQITETNIGNRLGVAGINERLQQLRSAVDNPQRLREVIDSLSGVTFSFKSTRSQNALNTVVSEFNSLGGLLIPGMSEETEFPTRRRDRFELGNTDPDNVARIERYIKDKLLFGNVIANAEEGDLNRLSEINENLPLLGDDGVPRNYREMVYNWEFDPNADNVDLSRMFITVTEAVNKLANPNTSIGKTNEARETMNRARRQAQMSSGVF